MSINSQGKSCIRYCAQHSKQGIVADLPCGVTVCWTQCSMMFTNVFFFSSPVADEADLRRRLEEIKTYVNTAQATFPWIFYIEPELLAANLRDQSQQICLAAEFHFAGSFKCMQATSLLPPLRPLSASDIKFAATQEDVYDALLLNTQAYNLDASFAEEMVENRTLVTDFDKQLCCIVSIDGKPVATATTVLLDECLYVVWVATAAQYRKVCLMLTFLVLYINWSAYFSRWSSAVMQKSPCAPQLNVLFKRCHTQNAALYYTPRKWASLSTHAWVSRTSHTLRCMFTSQPHPPMSSHSTVTVSSPVESMSNVERPNNQKALFRRVSIWR